MRNLYLLLLCTSLLSYGQLNCFKTNIKPIFDGDTTDECWATTTWNKINNTWIPYNNELPSTFTTESGTQTISGLSDFSARYKTLWSSTTNELFVLVEIKDDQFIDGYVFPNSGYSNFDVLEVFIDENRSGGNHLFDVSGNLASNAFAYHIMVNKPTVLGVTTAMIACDLVGTGWGNSSIVNYRSHFNDFIFKNADNDTYYYEFALKTYNSSFAQTSLIGGNLLGFTMAYCENDQNDNNRDSFIGSVTVTGAANNDSYINASIFGTLSLAGINDLIKPSTPTNATITNKTLSWSASTDYNGIVEYKIYRNNVFVNATTDLSLTLTGLAIDTDYWFKIQAIDPFGNSSLFSDSILLKLPLPSLTVTGNKNSKGHLTDKTFTLAGMNLIDTVSIQIRNDLRYFVSCDGIKESSASFSTTSRNFKKMPVAGIIAPTKFEIAPICIADFFCDYYTAIVVDTLLITSTGLQTLKVTYEWEAIVGCVDQTTQFETNHQGIVYPNPSNGHLHFSNQEADLVTLYDIYGTKVFSQKIENQHIDCSSLPKGFYIATVHVGSSRLLVDKIILE